MLSKTWILSISIHLLVLLILVFIPVYEEQIPPPPAPSIEIDFFVEEKEEEPIQILENKQQESRVNDNVHEEEITNIASPKSEEESPTTDDNVETSTDQPTTSAINQEALYPSQNNQNKPIEERAMYKNPSGEDKKTYTRGSSNSEQTNLEIIGWHWVTPPNPNDKSEETGKIIFEVKINNYGEIVAIKTLEKTVSFSVEKIYKESVERITFVSTTANPPVLTTGKITFIIKSK